ncbi:MAG: CobW family GTP-binding protein [Gemmataceae bacterium]
MNRLIPTNIITGFLGVGKTTILKSVLRRKPAEQYWAVLINEYGEVGLDAALIEGSAPAGVAIREVAGGCFCCTTAPYLPVALHFLLTEAPRPIDRLLVETSGWGHPARLLDTFHEHYADRLELRATWGVVDPQDFHTPGMRENRVFRDQMELADVLILHKLDVATPEQVAQFRDWANQLQPPKLLIGATSHGEVPLTWLDLDHSLERSAFVPPEHQTSLLGPESPNQIPSLGFPAFYPQGDSCGWIFSVKEIFEIEHLVGVLHRSGFRRWKAILRGADEWVSINAAMGHLTMEPTAYRRDSRLQVFAEPGSSPDWVLFQRELMASCPASGRK